MLGEDRRKKKIETEETYIVLLSDPSGRVGFRTVIVRGMLQMYEVVNIAGCPLWHGVLFLSRTPQVLRAR